MVDEEDALRKRVQKDQINQTKLAQIAYNHIPDHCNKGSSNTKGSVLANFGIKR